MLEKKKIIQVKEKNREGRKKLLHISVTWAVKYIISCSTNRHII